VIDGLPDALFHTVVEVCLLATLISLLLDRDWRGKAKQLYSLLIIAAAINFVITYGCWAFVFGVI
jgi:ABC-type sugar transport system permease subunit